MTNGSFSPVNKIVFLAVFLIQGALPSFGQQTGKLALRQVLISLERQFAVSFTYADENVENVYVNPVPENLEFQEILNILKEETQLEFRQINTRFIAIIRPQNAGRTQVCGIVLEYNSGMPLADIIVYNSEESTITDDSGYFSLETKTGDSLRFNSVRHLPVAILPDSEDCLQISLRIKTITLDEVIIRDFIASGISKTASGSVQVRADQLGILPGLIEPDVLHTVQALPGIHSVTEKVSDINIRGGTNDQNLITWNGIKMYQTGHFFGLISAFNPYLTEDVTFIRNGTTSLLGDGVSGSLLISSANEISDQFSGEAGVNMIYGDFWTRVPLSPRASVHLSARRSLTDLIQTPTYRSYFDRVFTNTEIIESSRDANLQEQADNEDFHFYDFSVKVLLDPTDHDRIRASFLNVVNSLTYDENLTTVNSTIEKTSSLEQLSRAGGITYDREWNPKVHSILEGQVSYYKLAALNQDIPNEQRLLQRNEILDFFLHAGATVAVTPKVVARAGYQLRETGVTNFDEINNPTFSRLVKEVVLIHSGYAETIYKDPIRQFSVTTGLRVNYYGKLDNWTLEPRLSVYKGLGEEWSVEFQGELKSQATSQVIDYQRDFMGVEKRRWLLSNGIDVPLLTSSQISGGISFHPQEMLVSLDIYYKEVDGITTSSQGFRNQFEGMRSTGSYTAVGADFLVNRDISEQLNIWLGYSYMISDYSFPELLPPEFPSNLDLRHSLTTGAAFRFRNLEISGGVNWHTGVPYTAATGVAPNGIDINYESPNSSRLTDYIRLDLSARYGFNMGPKAKGTIGAALWNIQDRENLLNTSYRTNGDNDLLRMDELALGITPNILFRVSF